MTNLQIISISILAIYYGIVIFFFFQLLLENKNPLKTQSYLLMMALLPGIGLFIYLFFGVNFRKKKMYSRKVFRDHKIIQNWIKNYENLLNQSSDDFKSYLHEKAKLPYLFWRNNYSTLSNNNKISILFNGEEKFPILMQKLREARHHIHFEYYILEDDAIGSQIIDLLCEKSKSGVKVRVIVDALGSSILSNKSIRKMKSAGIEFREYNPVIFMTLANKVNYRDHRKIVVIDGRVSFVGGINIADRYLNSAHSKNYWRDTHCMIEGEATYSLQVLFLLNWYFVSKELLKPNLDLFPEMDYKGEVVTSIVSSDPDSDHPNLMEAYFSMITSAREEILISTPYFIPNESILTALKTSAKGGVRVVLILPASTDSLFVHAASLTFLGELLRNDIEVHLYTKGMIHSKTMVIDEEICTIGTANMDYRSFDNNAEVNAVFFDKGVAGEVKMQFDTDLSNSFRLDYLTWKNRSLKVKLVGSMGRVVAPLL
jgi:cardiolipin synthase A/B